ncbi:ribosome silencing factor [Pseudonocardia sp. ICBG601]|uniref:ribosome silencing factor n=1 Tax=Pseudonocardia sp. ICBG601 TaxID=2846759 RepID=UPI001CF66676|nr:ribosome silencing factor [Pseudonocardia sp. ICBG601]
MTASPEAVELAKVAAAAAADKKAVDIVALDVSDQLALTDCFVLASAANERQVQAIVDEVEEKLRERGSKPTRREGDNDNGWVLLDFNDIVVHVMHTEQRGFYGLDRLWKDCPAIEVPDPKGDPDGTA